MEKQAGLPLIRTIDKDRVVKTLWTLNKSEIREIKLVIKETFVD
jgi:mRNA-degrading endonuclease toxin of MazEF toxin-antitoxin module